MSMRLGFGFVLATSLLAACALDEGDGVEDGEGEGFTSADGKADGYDLTEAEALGVLRLAGESTEAELRAAGLSTRVSEGITTYRAGKDRRLGTADDQAYDSLAELDAISYVGPRTLEAMLEAAKDGGLYDAGVLGRHDVSVLLPLPRTGDLPWSASTPGRGGALLPRAQFDRIGRSVFNAIDDGSEYDALRVVAIRFDPCFTTSLTSACQPQIRLVFQSLASDRADGTNDGALHALYNLTDDSFADVTARLRELASDATQNQPYQPLGVSPELKAQGMSGAYARGLGKILADHCGPATLARFTFMTRTLARQASWELGGFHVKANAATGFPASGPIEIVGSTETLQTIGNGGLGGVNYRITPGLADAAGTPGLSAVSLSNITTAQRKAVATWARTQNAPSAHVPDTTDCASCHVAGHTERMLEGLDRQFVSVDRGPRVITGAETAGDNLRAFGYFFADAHVSIRTANETAAVLRAFAQR